MTDKPTPKEIDDLVYELRQAGGEHGMATYFVGTPNEVSLRIDTFADAHSIKGKEIGMQPNVYHIFNSLKEENGRKVLSYWPYCSECRKPFEFEKDEPFASCGCPGSTEWGRSATCFLGSTSRV